MGTWIPTYTNLNPDSALQSGWINTDMVVTVTAEARRNAWGLEAVVGGNTVVLSPASGADEASALASWSSIIASGVNDGQTASFTSSGTVTPSGGS